jgi:hypothetical protein
MPPLSSRDRPALEVALSRDARRPGDHGWHSDTSQTGWEMLFGDGAWHAVDVCAWWTDDHGREVVQVYWYAEYSTWIEA